MKIVNAVVAILILVMGAGTLGARIFFYPDLGVEYVNVTMKLGSLFFLLLIVGFGLVCIWAEGYIWDKKRSGWDNMDLVVFHMFVLGLALTQVVVWEQSIFKFLGMGIVMAVNNLSI